MKTDTSQRERTYFSKLLQVARKQFTVKRLVRHASET
jgi:hypothetical protein